MTNLEKLYIYEIDYSVSPGGINVFEVYNSSMEYIGEFPSLIYATRFCDNFDCEYEVKLLQEYYSDPANN